MAQTGPHFILIDHSLQGAGGHNYQYAVDVLSAAESLGYRPVLAVNQRFAPQQLLSETWQIRPLFPHGWDARHWLGPDGKRREPLDVDGRCLEVQEPRSSLPQQFLSLVRWPWSAGCQRDRQERLRGFAEACAKLLEGIPWSAGSLVFLPSVSDFDFLALVRFLASERRTLPWDWHLQFHFDLFTGRLPDYASQEQQLQVLQRQFSAALARVPQHRLHFYATSQGIAEQYERLRLTEFCVLPYPFNSRLEQRASRDRACSTPLRVTCPGVIRREKGKHRIKRLVRGLWHEQLATGHLQLVFQGRQGQLRRYLPRSLAQRATFEPRATFTHGDPLVVVPHPLPVDDYLELILRADIGLFPYDAQRYHARCSGILVEMLASGVPVIVPAGCWLADQIAEPIYEHLDGLRKHAMQAEDGTLAGADWRSATGAPVPADSQLTFGDQQNAASLDVRVPAGARNLLFSLTWEAAQAPGHYLRVEAEQQVSARGGKMATQVAILGARPAATLVSALFHLNGEVQDLHLRISNAYGKQRLVARQPEAHWLAPATTGAAGFPAGQVGLIAASVECLPDQLRDMTEHYEHYQRTAREFAATWRTTHAPQRTIEMLQARSLPSTGGRQP